MSLRILSLFAALASTLASASSEILSQSVIDGRHPFLLVFNDKQGGSRREPGIYVQNESGVWSPAVNGNLLRGSTINGILAQLQVSSYTHRYESVAVIEGKIRVFDLQSSASDPQSYLTIGDNKAAIMDPFTGTQVRIGAVQSVADVAVHGGNVTSTGQIVIVSIRQPNMFGDGVTFAFKLKYPSTNQAAISTFVQPILLDYRFIPEGQLQKFLVADPGNPAEQVVYSGNLFRAKAQGSEQDAPLVKAWRQSLLAEYEALGGTGAVGNTMARNRRTGMGSDIGGLPFIDLNTNQPRIAAVPSVAIDLNNHFQATQVYNPMTGKSGLYFGLERRPVGEPFDIPGEISTNAQGALLLTSHTVSNNEMGRSVASYIDGNLSLLVQDGNGGQAVVLERGDRNHLPLRMTSLAHSVVTEIGNERRQEMYLFVSRQFADEQRTELFIINWHKKIFQLERSLFLKDIYLPPDQLSERIVRSIDQGLLFDYQTPAQESAIAYKMAAKDTQPYLNLRDTVNSLDHPQESFLKALEVIPANRLVSYEVYQDENARKRHSGIYLRQNNKRPIKVHPGEILFKSEADQQQKHIEWTKKDILGSGGQDTYLVKVSAIAIDPSFRHGKNGFNLVLAAATDSNDSTFVPATVELNFDTPIQDIEHISIIPGKRKKSRYFSVIVHVKDPNPSTDPAVRNPGAVFLYNFVLDVDRSEDGTAGTEVTFSTGSSKKLANELLDPNEVLRRIVYDEEGGAHYQLTPNLSKSDAKSRLLKLIDLIEHLPNSRQGKSGPRIRWDDATDDEEVVSAMMKGSWSVLGESTFRDRFSSRFPGATKAGKETTIMSPAAAFAPDPEEERLFPLLTNYLEQLASPQSEARHEILIVSQEDKPLIEQLILGSLVKKQNGKWRLGNGQLGFYAFDSERASQEEIQGNFEHMRRSNAKPVLFANATDLIAVNRPAATDEDNAFVIGMPDHEEDDSNYNPIEPHVLYMLATEGEAVSTGDFFNRMLMKRAPKKTSIVILATQDEATKLMDQLGEQEQNASLPDAFVQNANFASGSWKVWPPKNKRTSEIVKVYQNQPTSSAEQDIFPNLMSILAELSNPKESASHKVLLVPEELKGLVKKILFTRWVSESNDAKNDSGWNFRNNDLDLYQLLAEGGQTKLSQETLFLNFLALHGSRSAGKRPVLLGELSGLVANGRPASSGRPYIIEDTHVVQGEGLLSTTPSYGRSFGSLGPHQTYPHALWLLATEGRRLKADEFQNRPPTARQVPMLLVGTREEWERLRRELTLEKRFGLESDFEVHELSAPSVEARKTLLTQIFDRPEIRSLNLEFRSTNENPSDDNLGRRDRLLGYMANRTDMLANQFKLDSTSAFIKVLTELPSAITEDTTLRTASKKIIDRAFVERLFSKIFSIPLNMNTLPANDYLVRAGRGSRDTALALTKSGYRGSIDLKYRILKTIESQTRAGDDGRSIPSSYILYGDTSSGKTLLFDKLVEVFGLKTYKFHQPFDADVQAFKINVGTLVDKKKEEITSPDEVSVDQLIEHLNNFFALPNGYRGFVLFDDIHKATDENVTKKLFAYLQSLFDAPKGMIRVRPLPQGKENANDPSKIKEIPVRNLNIFITLNPTQDQTRIKKYVTAKPGTGDFDLEMVLASLARDGIPIEKSFLQRWGLVLNLSRFPSEAKAPALLESIRKASRDQFNTQGKLTLVSANALDPVVEQFPDANAREFLTDARSAFFELGENSNSSPVHVVSIKKDWRYFLPSLEEKGSIFATAAGGRPLEAQGRAGQMIGSTVKRTAYAVPLTSQKTEGQLHLLSVIIETYRNHLYEAFSNAINQEPNYVEDVGNRRYFLGTFLHAMTGNLVSRPRIPLSALPLDPRSFGATTPNDIANFRKNLSSWATFEPPFFPIKFANEFPPKGQLVSMLNPDVHNERERSRADLLSDAAAEIQAVALEYLREMLRVPTMHSLPTVEEWIKGLSNKDPQDASERAGEKLLKIYEAFSTSMYGPDLYESLRPGEFPSPTTYETFRLFMVAIDKAITRLPWDRTTNFLTRTLETAAQDMNLAQRSGIQHYLFSSEFSLLHSTTKDLIIQSAFSTEAYRQWTPEQKDSNERAFLSNCEKLVLQH